MCTTGRYYKTQCNSNEDKLQRELNYKLSYKFKLCIKSVSHVARCYLLCVKVMWMIVRSWITNVEFHGWLKATLVARVRILKIYYQLTNYSCTRYVPYLFYYRPEDDKISYCSYSELKVALMNPTGWISQETNPAKNSRVYFGHKVVCRRVKKRRKK